MAESTLHVQVCFAMPAQQWLRSFEVAPGTTVHQAIVASGILADVPQIDLSVWKVGIYGKIKPLGTELRQHDRVEIYRPLTADPMESRRRRAVKRAAAG